MRMKKKDKDEREKKKNEKGVEIGNKKDHSDLGVCDTPWIPKEGISQGVLVCLKFKHLKKE